MNFRIAHLFSYTVSLLGKPNVGKSSLFNAMLATYQALTHNQPGFTRNLRIQPLRLADICVKLIDTPGMSWQKQSMHEGMLRLSLQSAKSSDINLLVVDAKNGVDDNDMQIALQLRKLKVLDKTILVANKAQGTYLQYLNAVYQMRLGDPFEVSAAEGKGVIDLCKLIYSRIPDSQKQLQLQKQKARRMNFGRLLEQSKQQLGQKEYQLILRDLKRVHPFPEFDSQFDEQNTSLPVKISIIGRPNVGKSSLVNRLLERQRSLVNQQPGTTTDSVSSNAKINGRSVQIIDTAGIVNRKHDQIQGMVYAELMRTIKSSDVVIYMIDMSGSFRTTDFKIIQRVVQQGRGMVLAVNKWDLFDQKFKLKASNFLKKQMERNLGQLSQVPLVKVSAIKDSSFQELINYIFEVQRKWKTRIPASKLNAWLQEVKKISPLPNRDEDVLNIKLILQTRTRPPTFVLFMNNPDLFKRSYETFLKRKLSAQFGLQGVVLRMRASDSKSKKEQLRRKVKKEQKKDKWKEVFE